MGGIDPRGSYQFCRVAAQSSGCVPALAPGNKAHWRFGEADDGVQEADSGSKQRPQGPACESQEVPWGLAATD